MNDQFLLYVFLWMLICLNIMCFKASDTTKDVNKETVTDTILL